ncbi:MAG: hypothetical protein JJE35_11850 [Thermoleophilia bacterium]|nr:hypothetical protein [Thermoleophilia bacterium]
MGGGEPHADCRQGKHRTRDLDRQDVLISAGAGLCYPEAGAALFARQPGSANSAVEYSGPIKASRLLILLFFATALALPASASARPGWDVQKRSLHLSLEAHASNGYELWVETLGHRRVNLGLAKGGVVVSYTTSGRVSRDRIEADFGELGEVSVRLRGKPVPFELIPGLGLPRNLFPHRDCRGRKPVREAGSFRGTIRFRGEHGFAAVDLGDAKGEMRRYYRRLCKRGKLIGPRGRPQASYEPPRMNVITVGGRTAGRSVFFEALGFEGGPRNGALTKSFGSLAFAGTVEHRDRVRIDRLAMTEGDEGSLIVSPHGTAPVRATVALPKPLEGTAELTQAAGEPTSWIGSLQVHLPGAGTVPLTGPELTPVFCRVALFSELRTPCVRRSEKAIPEPPRIGVLLAQGSGSHSQAFAEARLSWSR